MDDEKKKAVEVLLKKKILVSPDMLSRASIEEIENLGNPASKSSNVSVLFSYVDSPKKREFQDFVDYFNSRFKSIEGILVSRPELKNTTTISRLKFMSGRESVSIIGMVRDKSITKNGNIILNVEDQTGMIKVLVTKNKQSVFAMANDTVHDEVIGIVGAHNGEIIFANSLILPDIPHSELKKSPDEGYAVFLSDIHVGSKKFLSEDFSRFIKWIDGKLGNDEQKDVAAKVKYVIVSGDVVDGVGIYPNQEEELEITDIYEQYSKCAELLKKIPPDKKIIVSPGNHDSMRISEPQPPFSGPISAPLLELPNLIAVSNPGFINIDSSKNFGGFDVLIYHGYSFDHYVANVESIRMNGGYDRADLIMKFLLQRRHLSPTHSSTLYLPISNDHLVIGKVPDFFVTGHIHRAYASHYKHVTLLSGSCWQGKTSFQERMGHVPQPSRVPIVNLKTREVKILKFGAENDEG